MTTTVLSSISNSTTQARVWESAVPPSLQFALGVIGNLISLIVLLMSRKRHKWKPFYRLVVGLALTDGGGILLVYPIVMMRYESDFTYDFPKPVCDYSSFIFTFTPLSSALIVCAMSFDRFLAILYPFKYNIAGKERRTNITLLSIWTFSTFVSSLHLMGLGSSCNFYPGSWCFLNFVGSSTMDRVNSFIYSILGYSILITTISLNIFVIITLCKNIRASKQGLNRKVKKSDVFNMILLLVIVVAFTVCWIPLISIIFAHAAMWIEGNGPRELLVLRFAVTNSVVDPWIYILLRKENLRILQKRCGGFCGKFNLTTESSTQETTPSSFSLQRRSM
ncbi:prostaglandin E2 receptor EP4 subtype-like [Saccostrea echinata]|uniref:prostaglandin E2 receptor EP4 subtype-like n=1 Tax=Saccostrea echinata TaxID=191078 RepID=UPI002A83395F|nr:prostaglandin E2 receptor EP4 subtype-like [Saccostrea echinata]